MKEILPLTVLSTVAIGGNIMFFSTAIAEQPLFIAYPPDNHQTTSQQIFFIGTAPTEGEVSINRQPIKRSKAGHFAPSFPLQLGENKFTIRYQNQAIELKVIRRAAVPEIPSQLAFAADSLGPAREIGRLPGELICFGAIAPPNVTVSVQLGQQNIPLLPQSTTVQLLPNSAVYIPNSQSISMNIGKYQGCTSFSEIGKLGTPLFQLSSQGQTITQTGLGSVEILNPDSLEVREVIAEKGVVRTGPGTDYSRLTPLPKGARATVTGREGDWLRLDYGAWIQEKETQVLADSIPPKSLIRSINYRQLQGETQIIFPLEIPVPVTVEQRDNQLILTLHNTTAQTDTIRLDDGPVIRRLDWQQVRPNKIKYTFQLKSHQQWGYNLQYEGNNLILSLRHPPKLIKKSQKKLAGITILLDPGHGGEELGARGPNGYPEKAVNLTVAKLVRQELIREGATVYMTRESDRDVSLQERIDLINELKPTIALSIHYNALPDSGDALNTQGISTFWYHSQAQELSVFLHNYLVEKLQRTSHGVYWNNLALTRPSVAPSVLLELGFVINPEEFEWVTNPQEQEKLARVLAEAITAWFQEQD